MISYRNFKNKLCFYCNPFFVFCGLLALSYIVPSTTTLTLIGISFGFLAVYACVLKFTINMLFMKQPEVFFLLALCVYSLLSLLWSPWNELVFLLKELTRIAIVVGIMFLFLFLTTDIKTQKIDLFIIFMLAIYGILFLLNSSNILFDVIAAQSDPTKLRFLVIRPGLFYNPIPVGWMFAMGLLLSMHRIFVFERKIKLLMIFVCFIFLSMLIIAQSRGAFVGLMAGVFVLSVLRTGLLGRYLFLATLSIIFLFLITYFFTDYHLIKHLVSRGDSARFDIFNNALEAISQHPIFGHGFGASSVNMWKGKTFYHYHNIYLSTLFYGGIIGLLLFFCFIISFLVKSFKIKEAHGWYSVVVMALTAFLFDGNHFITYPSAELYILVLPVLLSVAIRLQTTESKEPE